MSTNTLIPNAIRLAHELRLFGIHAGIERRANEALAASHHPLEYLRLIMEDEKLFRQERTAKMLSSRAKFRSDASLEEWDHAHERGLTKAQFREVATLSFYQNRERQALGKPTLPSHSGKNCATTALGSSSFPSIFCLKSAGQKKRRDVT